MYALTYSEMIFLPQITKSSGKKPAQNKLNLDFFEKTPLNV